MDIVDIATREYVEVDADDRLGKVRAVFERENPKGLVVADGGDYLGVITQKELVQSHIEDDTKAATLTKSAPRVERTSDIRDVARALVEGGAKIAPVYEGEQLWGIVDEDSILQAVLSNLDALTVAQIHTEDPVTIREDATVGRAINQMREHGISRLPIENDNAYLAGVVTTHDIVDFVVRDMNKTTRGDRAGDTDRMLDLPVYDLMSSPVETAAPDETVGAAVGRMLENDYAGLVVTDDEDDREIRGILTKTDVLRALSYTEEEHMDVQITNIDLLDGISRTAIRQSIEEIADKFQRMQVQHAHVRFHQHKEKLRGTPLLHCQIRLRTDRGQIAGSGEGYGAEHAFNIARDKLERNVLGMKGIESDQKYEGQLLRKLGEL